MISKEKILLLTLAAVLFTNILDFMIMMPLGPKLMRLFSINPSEFSIIVSSYSISAFIASFAGSFWMDKIDRKTALLFNYSFFSLEITLIIVNPPVNNCNSNKIKPKAFNIISYTTTYICNAK